MPLNRGAGNKTGRLVTLDARLIELVAGIELKLSNQKVTFGPI